MSWSFSPLTYYTRTYVLANISFEAVLKVGPANKLIRPSYAKVASYLRVIGLYYNFTSNAFLIRDVYAS